MEQEDDDDEESDEESDEEDEGIAADADLDELKVRII